MVEQNIQPSDHRPLGRTIRTLPNFADSPANRPPGRRSQCSPPSPSAATPPPLHPLQPPPLATPLVRWPKGAPRLLSCWPLCPERLLRCPGVYLGRVTPRLLTTTRTPLLCLLRHGAPTSSSPITSCNLQTFSIHLRRPDRYRRRFVCFS